jgi:predicted nucleic acid-binding Zn ribbon protein
VKIKCEVCSKEFEPVGQQVCCSDECWLKMLEKMRNQEEDTK